MGDALPVRHDPDCPGVWRVRRDTDTEGRAACSRCGEQVDVILVHGLPIVASVPEVSGV